MQDGEHSVVPWLRLSLVPGLTGAALRRLLEAFGSPGAILSSSRGALGRVVDPALAEALVRGAAPESVDAALAWANADGQQILVPGSPGYPALLEESPDPPPVLYAAGRIELIERFAIAVVGSRNATAQGMRNAERFARAIADAGCSIVSGLALGIDAAAHRGGLDGEGSSIAVLGNGIDVVYPRRNASLYAELRQRGLLLSEFPLGTAPLAGNFPRRNRVIGAISRGCLIVEAAIPSGSLITARIAADLGREVFAIPGSIHSPLSKGCHFLIKQGAKLVESAQDVLEEFGIEPQAEQRDKERISPDRESAVVLQALGHDPASIETLLARTQLPIDRLIGVLAQLEIQGRVSAVPGGFYQRVT